MRKPFVKKLLFLVGTLALALTAFIAGGIVMSSAHAASTPVPDTSTPVSNKCPADSGETKVVVTVNTVNGNTIQATVQEPADKKGNAITVTTTASTVYKPDASVVAAGKTVAVIGTTNSDGSITARGIESFDPTAADTYGVITKIDGLTITVQAKDSTHTILVTDSTTFLKGQRETKETQPAAQSDLKVGELIGARGKLNSDGSLTAAQVIIVETGGSAE